MTKKEAKIISDKILDTRVDIFGRLRVTREIITEPYEITMEIEDE